MVGGLQMFRGQETSQTGCLLIEDALDRVNHSYPNITSCRQLDSVSGGSACHIKLIMLGENLFVVNICVGW